METSFEALNTTSYYYVGQLSGNSSVNESVGEPLECKQEINSSGLFDFIIYGVLVNLVGLFGILGNAISMIILSRPQMKSSINYLLIGLARCDTILIVIAVSPLHSWCILTDTYQRLKRHRKLEEHWHIFATFCYLIL